MLFGVNTISTSHQEASEREDKSASSSSISLPTKITIGKEIKEAKKCITPRKKLNVKGRKKEELWEEEKKMPSTSYPLQGVGEGRKAKKSCSLEVVRRRTDYLHMHLPEALPGRPVSSTGSSSAASPPSSWGCIASSSPTLGGSSVDIKGIPGGAGDLLLGNNGTLHTWGERDCAATFSEQLGLTVPRETTSKTTAGPGGSTEHLTSQWKDRTTANLGNKLGLATPDDITICIIPGD